MNGTACIINIQNYYRSFRFLDVVRGDNLTLYLVAEQLALNNSFLFDYILYSQKRKGKKDC
jgi:hypothetical protein